VSEGRWLLLIHQIPPKPNYFRVKVWRRLQRLGAVAIKNSVYVLPKTDQAQEDFEWILREIIQEGGDASLCEARFVEGLSDQQVEALFHAARDADYLQITEEARGIIDSLPPGFKGDEDRRTQLLADLARLKRRLSQVGGIDFFGAPGHEAAEAAVSELEERVRDLGHREEGAVAPTRIDDLRGRIWVTRKGIHVDRMASAWLIRRFIDRDAHFKFVLAKGYVPEPGELRFDMFQAEFTHEGNRCTFEVLIDRAGLDDPALRPIAEIVHDLDLKDSKFSRHDALGIDRLISGITFSNKDDETRLERSAAVFDDLYEYFKRKRE